MTNNTKILIAFGLWFFAAFLLSWFCKKAWHVYLGSAVLFIPAIAYDMYLEGPVEMGGIVHVLCAGIYPLGLFYFLRWIRKNRNSQ
jgi:hypothetical protein